LQASARSVSICPNANPKEQQVREVPTTKVTMAYTPEYLDWKLGAGHPTNPERARLAVESSPDGRPRAALR
jgi:hypothetical protein